MARRPAVGFTLQPEERFLALVEPLVAEWVDVVEVAPETLWRVGEHGRFVPNGFFAATLELGRRHAARFVAHGVGLSTGSATSPERRACWLDGIMRTHEAFRFGWYTEHLGATSWGGEELALPLGVPMTDARAATISARLAELQRIVPAVGLENTVAYFTFGSPLDEPAFLARALAAPRRHLLLDLHNLYTMSLDHGFDADDYLARLDLGAVIELHVSGGADSDPAWLPGGETLRLDSHDDAVPDAVFELLERVLPRCPNVRAVTLERMEGTVDEPDVPVLRDELRRIAELVR